jgi:hypothetical protein
LVRDTSIETLSHLSKGKNKNFFFLFIVACFVEDVKVKTFIYKEPR